jgi:hypothetical protein
VNDIPDDIFDNLPEGPHMASFELLTRVEKKLVKTSHDEAILSTACGVFAAFYEMNNWSIPEAVSPRTAGLALSLAGNQKPESINDAIEWTRSIWRLQYEAYRSDIMGNRSVAIKQAAKESIAAVSSGTFGYTVLSKEEKTLIQKHIEKIREIIESSKLEDRKKNALFDDLTKLDRDVNRNGTRTDRFFAFASELGFCAGDFAKQAKPLFDEVKAILKIVTRARARDENIQLPSNGEILSLPEPDQDQNSSEEA